MEPPDAQPRRGPRWLVPAVVIAAVVGAIALGAHKPVLTYWVKRDIEGAADAEAEYQALCRANHWFHDGLTHGYGVRTFGRDGEELRPWQDGDYESVARVTLQWDGGQEVTRALLSTRPLDCVFGE
ncbi:MAG: hypothetical protein KDK70_18245 [Myxococcales bacterium]|nr:hypothetical protein [Myxococcales bacterium]